jgi:hypothetical protein
MALEELTLNENLNYTSAIAVANDTLRWPSQYIFEGTPKRIVFRGVRRGAGSRFKKELQM